MEREQRTVRTRRGFRTYTYLGCPLTRNRAPWCFRLCEPDDQGRGRCGRVAPHGLQGETARSIARHNKELMETHFERLEHVFLADERHANEDVGVSIREGEADIVIPTDAGDFRPDGTLDTLVCFRMLQDVATLAANSVVRDVFVRPESFNVQYDCMTPVGELAARGRFVGISEGQYLAESVLVDADGREVCRGAGAFVPSGAALPTE